MTLRDLIAALERIPPRTIIRHGFGPAHSYRGFYDEVAFEPVAHVTAESMLVHARSALGRTFTGYKGGSFSMHESTECWISQYGVASDDRIGETLIKYWMGEDVA